jgi:hypothetical protein
VLLSFPVFKFQELIPYLLDALPLTFYLCGQYARMKKETESYSSEYYQKCIFTANLCLLLIYSMKNVDYNIWLFIQLSLYFNLIYDIYKLESFLIIFVSLIQYCTIRNLMEDLFNFGSIIMIRYN